MVEILFRNHGRYCEFKEADPEINGYYLVMLRIIRPSGKFFNSIEWFDKTDWDSEAIPLNWEAA